ncbi:MAG: Dabb family protein, partial [Bacteroidales bacterium]|nr:Dabb family protein [Bacteroidales bacterium]
ASLKTYATHPAHLEVANGKVRPFTSSRVCMDYSL